MAGQQQSGVGNMMVNMTGAAGGAGAAPAGDPFIRITIHGASDRDKDPAKLAEFTLVIPRALSLRVAAMHAIEQVAKQIKKGLADALKQIGFK